MADSENPRRRRGCLSRIGTLILFVSAVALGMALYRMWQPQDLSDIGGYGMTAPVAERNMKEVLKNSIDRGYPLTLTEAELNEWLGRSLELKQGGVLAEKVDLKRVWIRLEKGVAEVIMEREVFGKPMTVSMFLQVEKSQDERSLNTMLHLHGGPFHPDVPSVNRGGRFGRLEVPQGFLVLVMPSFQKLAKLFPEEIRMGIEEMSQITIEDGRLILDPKAEMNSALPPPTF
jgi:hypothetical protein